MGLNKVPHKLWVKNKGSRDPPPLIWAVSLPVDQVFESATAPTDKSWQTVNAGWSSRSWVVGGGLEGGHSGLMETGLTWDTKKVG